ncbi:SnoaL-domain-containing protein [Stipitochalara longipes BDJ]|nr:SnoaL-domain-containing protein [Stipitochalara longipes BDJ]
MDNALSLRERNRQVVARYFEEFWTKGNSDVVDEVCTEDYVLYYPLHGRHVGREAIKKMFADFKEAFPDICFRLMFPFPLIAEDEYVVARWVGGGKHTGPAFFDLPIGGLPEPNSGREMRFSGTTIYTLKEGKIVEETGEEAGLLALQQLGLIPAK